MPLKPFKEEKFPQFAVDFVKQQLFPDELVKQKYLRRKKGLIRIGTLVMPDEDIYSLLLTASFKPELVK